MTISKSICSIRLLFSSIRARRTSPRGQRFWAELQVLHAATNRSRRRRRPEDYLVRKPVLEFQTCGMIPRKKCLWARYTLRSGKESRQERLECDVNDVKTVTLTMNLFDSVTFEMSNVEIETYIRMRQKQTKINISLMHRLQTKRQTPQPGNSQDSDTARSC
jgi:hypothetical protein